MSVDFFFRDLALVITYVFARRVAAAVRMALLARVGTLHTRQRRDGAHVTGCRDRSIKPNSSLGSMVVRGLARWGSATR